MFITSWTIDIRINIQIWLLYRRYKSEWYNFWWATIQDIAACACKVWTLFDQACGQEECSQTTMTTTTTTTTTDKSGLHRLTTDILSWAKKQCQNSFSRNDSAAGIVFVGGHDQPICIPRNSSITVPSNMSEVNSVKVQNWWLWHQCKGAECLVLQVLCGGQLRFSLS